MTNLLHNEEFLDFKIKMIAQVFEVEFTGSTHQEKHDFYKEYEDDLKSEIQNTFRIMNLVQNSKVFYFESKIGYIEEYIAATKREEALELFAEVLTMLDIAVPDDLIVAEKNIYTDTVWVYKNFVPESDLQLFTEQDDTHVNVPLIYAMSYALTLDFQETPFFI